MAKNWSINLETEEYAADRDLIVKDAVQAILDTEEGSYVNLATAEVHGDPIHYLIPILEKELADKIDIRFIDQCGCGGYVYRIFRKPVS